MSKTFTWNHRVVTKVYKGVVMKEKLYEIRECHYGRDKKTPTSCTMDAIAASSDTLDGLREVLTRMLRATYDPVLKYESIGKKAERP